METLFWICVGMVTIAALSALCVAIAAMAGEVVLSFLREYRKT